MEKELPDIPYIIFDKSQYEEEKDLWNDIGQLIQILTLNNYTTLVKYEDCGFYRIEYVYSDLELGSPRFVGLTAEQHEYILDAILYEE